MLRVFRWLRARVPLRTWAWIHAFLALGVGWGSAITMHPPSTYDGIVDPLLVIRMGIVTAIGAIIATLGMLITRSLSSRRQQRGLWIELIGTVLLAGGPLQYFSLQLGFLLDEGLDLRYALAWFAYAMCAFVFIRFTIIIPALVEASQKARIQSRRTR